MSWCLVREVDIQVHDAAPRAWTRYRSVSWLRRCGESSQGKASVHKFQGDRTSLFRLLRAAPLSENACGSRDPPAARRRCEWVKPGIRAGRILTFDSFSNAASLSSAEQLAPQQRSKDNRQDQQQGSQAVSPISLTDRRNVTPRAAVLALAALAALSACRRAEEPPPPEVRPVRVISVEQRAAGDTVSLTGTVQAQTEVNFSFRIDGRMIDRSVNVGDTVRPGQALARLDPSNEDSSLQSARAQLASVRAQAVEQRNNYNRQKELLAQRFISQAAFDAIAANLQSAEAAGEVRPGAGRARAEPRQLHAARRGRGRRGDGSRRRAGRGGAGRAHGRDSWPAQGGRDAVFDVPGAGHPDSAPKQPARSRWR